MRPILILTKNLMLEQELQLRLQHLNYEVFCSVKLYDYLRINNYEQNDNLVQFMSNYQSVIISETISDSEIKLILPILKKNDWVIFRKFSSNPSEKKVEQLKNSRIDGWLGPDYSIDLLREQLSDKLSDDQHTEMNIVTLFSNQTDTRNIAQLKRSLSTKEKMMLDCLIEAKGETVSREMLCSNLWNDSPTNSHLSQASVLIKKIKMKLEMAGYDPEILQTVWGRGYYLTKSSLSKERFAQAN